MFVGKNYPSIFVRNVLRLKKNCPLSVFFIMLTEIHQIVTKW